ncbi:MAG: hypothetical protein RIS35_2484 [Pseudomonadota bacterium]
MVDRFVAGNDPLRKPTEVFDWVTGRTLAKGFTTREDAEAAAKAASMAYREGIRAAQGAMRRALGVESDD